MRSNSFKFFILLLLFSSLLSPSLISAQEKAMDWFYARYGVNASNWAQIPITALSRDDYSTLVGLSMKGNVSALNALRATLLPYLLENPEDTPYEELRREIYDLQFLEKTIDIESKIILDVPPEHRHYTSLLLRALSSDPNLITSDKIPSRYLRDRAVANLVLEQNGALLYLFPDYQNNRYVVRTAVSHQSANGALEFASERLRDDYDTVKRAIQASPDQYQFISERLMDDKQLALLALKKDGRLLSFMNDQFRANPDIVLVAVRQEPYAISAAPASIRGNQSIMSMLIQEDGDLLQFATPTLRNEKRLVMDAVNDDPQAIRYASASLRRDPEIIDMVVDKDPSTKSYIDVYYRLGSREDIGYIYKFLKRQKDLSQLNVNDFSQEDYERVILEAYSGDEKAAKVLLQTLYPYLATVEGVSGELGHFKTVLYSQKFLENVMPMEPEVLHFTPNQKDYMVNLVLQMLAVKKELGSLTFLPSFYRNNVDIMELLVKRDPKLLKYGSNSIQNTRSVVWQAIQRDGMALRYASSRLRDDYKIVVKAVSQTGLSLQYASERLQNSLPLVQKAVMQNGLALEFASNQLKKDSNLVNHAVADNGLALKFSSSTVKGNKGVVETAFRNNRKSLKYASLKMQLYFLFVQFWLK
jgi:uncharacterized protein YfkK (UPF0435 family)